MPELTFSLPDVDALDQVPEEYRSFYFEKDGKVQRQNPQMMASTMAKVRRENEKLAGELLDRDNLVNSFKDVFGEDMPDADEIRGLIEKAGQADKLPTDADVEKRISTLEANHKKQLAAKDTEISARDKTIEQVTVRRLLQDALNAARANKDGLELLPEPMRSRTEMVIEEDGNIKLHPLDEDGTRMYTEDGGEASLVDLANKMREDRPIFFEGTRASGLDSGGEAVTLPRNSKNWYKMTRQEKIEFTKEHGEKAANTLMMKSDPTE